MDSWDCNVEWSMQLFLYMLLNSWGLKGHRCSPGFCVVSSYATLFNDGWTAFLLKKRQCPRCVGDENQQFVFFVLSSMICISFKTFVISVSSSPVDVCLIVNMYRYRHVTGTDYCSLSLFYVVQGDQIQCWDLPKWNIDHRIIECETFDGGCCNEQIKRRFHFIGACVSLDNRWHNISVPFDFFEPNHWPLNLFDTFWQLGSWQDRWANST